MRSSGQEDLAAIFDRCAEKVYGYVAFRVAPDFEAAQDITQEVFLAALEGLDSFRGDGPILTWLRGIARRKVAAHFRTKGRETSLSENDLTRPVRNPDPSATNREARALLLSLAMRQLPETSVELLEEKYLEDRSIKEMAQRRGHTEKAVESALSRAREKARRLMEAMRSQKEQ